MVGGVFIVLMTCFVQIFNEMEKPKRPGGAAARTVTLMQEFPRFGSNPGLSVRGLHVLPVPTQVLSGYSDSFPQYKD